MIFHSLVSNLSESFRKNKDRIAVLEYKGEKESPQISYSELDTLSDNLASVLLQYSVKKGEVVGVCMRRSCEHVAALIAISKTGGAFFSIHQKYSLVQIEYLLDLTKIRFLLVDNASLIRIASLSIDNNLPFKIIHIKDGPLNKAHEASIAKIDKFFSLETIDLSSFKSSSALENVPKIVGNDLAMVLFTSGTTGLPKGVMISHSDLINRAMHEIKAYEIDPEDVLLNLLTFSFDVGCNQLFSCLLSGACLTINNSWLPKDILSSIRKFNVTGISGVPTIWNELLNYDEELFQQTITNVRYITVSGGDLPVSYLKRLHELLGGHGTGIYKTYGQTETFRSSMLIPEDFKSKMFSVGRPVPGTNIVIIRPDGELAQSGEEGEILHQGMGTMLGYINDDKGTQKKLKAPSFFENIPCYIPSVIFTGDYGKFDEDGFLYLLGRKDKMIKIRGNRIYPQEVLNQVSLYDGIIEAAVFANQDQHQNTSLYMEVKLKEGTELTTQQLQLFLMKRLPSYMIPSRIIFVEDFPRTGSGKIDMVALEAKYCE